MKDFKISVILVIVTTFFINVGANDFNVKENPFTRDGTQKMKKEVLGSISELKKQGDVFKEKMVVCKDLELKNEKCDPLISQKHSQKVEELIKNMNKQNEKTMKKYDFLIKSSKYQNKDIKVDSKTIKGFSGQYKLSNKDINKIKNIGAN